MILSRRVSGFTMIEMLVALAILGIGLLGLGALSTFALQTAKSAALRSFADVKASDMAETIRLEAGLPSPGQGYLAAWQAEIATLLPSGVGQIASPDGGQNWVVTVSWDEWALDVETDADGAVTGSSTGIELATISYQVRVQ